MRNALMLAAAMTITGGQLSEAKPTATDNGIDTLEEAANLVRFFQRRGADEVLKVLVVDGTTVVLYNAGKCEKTSPNYANGIALTKMQAVSGNDADGMTMEIVKPVDPSLSAMDVKYLRVCDKAQGGVANLTGQPLNLVHNNPDSEGERRLYKLFEGFRGAVQAIESKEEPKR